VRKTAKSAPKPTARVETDVNERRICGARESWSCRGFGYACDSRGATDSIVHHRRSGAVQTSSLSIVLLDCDVNTRRRLTDRGQPDLATARMDTWAAYLRGQAA
jgi:hypothetical protein